MLWYSNCSFAVFSLCVELLVVTISVKGSRDNMSVVIVAFPGAPSVSKEAQQKDRELDQLLENKIQGTTLPPSCSRCLSIIYALSHTHAHKVCYYVSITVIIVLNDIVAGFFDFLKNLLYVK